MSTTGHSSPPDQQGHASALDPPSKPDSPFLPPDHFHNPNPPSPEPTSAPPAGRQRRIPDRITAPPARAATTGSAPDADPASANLPISYAHSDDLSHQPRNPLSRDTSLSGSAPDSDLASSAPSTRYTTPSSADQHSHQRPSAAPVAASAPTGSAISLSHLNSEHRERRKSTGSTSSGGSSEPDLVRKDSSPSNGSTVTSSAGSAGPCSSCAKPLQGAFVRALGTVFHINCFSCMDCGDLVASKFFPVEGPSGKQHPLCEKDYFRRLNLICTKCDTALRGSYITACNKKYHVEHFTCSICPTLFGPQDSYYEHDGDVYCHFHYSTRFATKCVGCNSAIIKQFVEINRNMRDECWHPECYMINKFWNVKVVTKRPTSNSETEGSGSVIAYLDEQNESAVTLKEKQSRMEQLVFRIWTVLSAFEESSASCISDMLRLVSSGQYLDAIRMAEKFNLHVEVLFATIDDLEYQFVRDGLKGLSHVREARMLCRKTVDLFTLLSRTQETGARRMTMTQELLALVTGLAHYLKMLIRIALTGALKLERERNVSDAMSAFLDKLHLLAVQGGNPNARRLVARSNGEVIAAHSSGGSGKASGNLGTQGVSYGFRSLAPENAGESPFAIPAPPANGAGQGRSAGQGQFHQHHHHPPSDLCVKCGLTVEEDCVRLGTYQRWHSHCVQCEVCGRNATVAPSGVSSSNSNSGHTKEREPAQVNSSNPTSEEKDKSVEKSGSGEGGLKISTARRPPANVALFVYDVDSLKDTPSFGDVPTVLFCTDHARGNCRAGFQAVSRLEQYAFLLNVALRRLYSVLKKQGVLPLSPASVTVGGAALKGGEPDPYRSSSDIMRMKTVHLDRKLSTTAHLPKRSTVIESPAGKSIHESDVVHSPRWQDGPPQRLLWQPPKSPTPQNRSPLRMPPARPPPPPPEASLLSMQVPPLPPQQQQPQQQQQQSQVLRPAFARNNTAVKIVDDSGPTVTGAGDAPGEQGLKLRDGSLLSDVTNTLSTADDGITLADIPHIVEAAQAREQHRSLPRESATPYIAELSAVELSIVKHAAVLALHRSPLRDQFELDEILELLELKKGGFFYKLFNKSGSDKKVKKKGVFGVPLELLVEREGADSLLGATRSTLRVPSFIDDVVSAMRQMDMSIEGIFRKNGNIRRLKDLAEAIDRDPSLVDLSQDNPVQLAALLKKFLRDLPEPLMTFKLHKLFISTQSASSDEERMRLLHMVSIILPKAHRDTMEVLFTFLKWVASFAHMDEETGSKMDLPNLATVICPSILYARGRDAVRDDSFSAIRVVTSLLEHQDELFQVPLEFLPILDDQEYFANSMELPSKDILKKCDTYMRLKTNGRPPPMTSPSNSGQLLSNPAGNHVRFPSPNLPNHNNSGAERPPMVSSSSLDSSRGIRPPPPGGISPSPSSQAVPQLPPLPLRSESSGLDWQSTPRLRPTSWLQPPRPNEDTSPQQLLVQNGMAERQR